MKETFFSVLQIVLSFILIVLILIQQKGSGLSSVLGGTGAIYSTKRGIDKVVHYATIGSAVLFFGVSLVRLFI